MPTPLQNSRCQVEIVAMAGGMNFLKRMPVPAHQTLAWAVNASGLYAKAPQLRKVALGVWGKIMPPDTLVAEGDRIEVYQQVAPEAVQQHRANLQKKKNNAKVEPHV